MYLYKIDKKFAAAAAKYGTRENILLKNIRTDFPGMDEVVISGREQTTARANRHLKYENMERHIRAYENAEEILEVFKTVKTMSAPLASPYKYVADWFKAQFPNYKETPILQAGVLTVVPKEPPKITEYKQKLPKVG